jgi:hypothetical protein
MNLKKNQLIIEIVFIIILDEIRGRSAIVLLSCQSKTYP